MPTRTLFTYTRFFLSKWRKITRRSWYNYAYVIHTPRMAGRTKEANYRFAEMLIELFLPNQ
jgi:hypothetical protein